MAVIACLRWPPAMGLAPDGAHATPLYSGCAAGSAREALLDFCAQLTPIVEPDDDCIWMDWTGCGEVRKLAEKLSAELARLSGATAAAARSAAARAPLPPSGTVSSFLLGVAPLRFAAGALAAADLAPVVADRSSLVGAVGIIEAPPLRGFHVAAESLPRLLPSLRLCALRELDAATCETLASLNVHTLGDLARFPRELLYGHVGRVAAELLDWAGGRDERRVRALYPPARLERRLAAEELGLSEAWPHGAPGAFDLSRVQRAVFLAAEQLGAELAHSRRACGAAAVALGGRRVTRRFSPPIANSPQLGRVLWQMVQRLLDEAARAAPAADGARHGEAGGDCVVTITPVANAGRQTTLFTYDRLGSPREERRLRPLELPALAAVRARFGPLLRLWAAEGGGGFWREEVARYETMRRFYS